MFNRSQVIVGLEVGTSKVCAVVGELAQDGNLRILGIGQARSRGVRKGEIVDPEKASEDIRNTVVEAEQMADVEIRSLYLGVTGSHIRGFNNRGSHPVVSADREIAEEDVQDVVKNAKAINLPAENHVIHVVRQHFRVDGQDGIQNPVGLLGARVEIDVHVVHGNLNRLQNAIRAVKGLQIDVEDIVFTGMASSLALLTNEHKEMGALVIDLGGGATEFVVCLNGIIKQTGVFTVGGDHIANDLAYGLKVPLARAEHLKIEHGRAVLDPADQGKTVTLPSEKGLPEKVINLEHLQRIMTLRVEEILEMIADELDRGGILPYLRAGVFLCGGGARIPGITELAQRVFGVPATVGRIATINGLNEHLDQPEFASPVGLAKFGSFQSAQRQVHGSPWRRAISHVFGL